MSHEDNITKASLSQRIHELESRLAANEAAYDEAYLISVAAKNDANALREELAVAVEALGKIVSEEVDVDRGPLMSHHTQSLNEDERESTIDTYDWGYARGQKSAADIARDALAKIKETK